MYIGATDAGEPGSLGSWLKYLAVVPMPSNLSNLSMPSSQESSSTEAADLKGLILLFRVSESLHRVRQVGGDVLHSITVK